MEVEDRKEKERMGAWSESKRKTMLVAWLDFMAYQPFLGIE